MLPRLRAEDAQHQATVVAVGSGSLKRQDAQSIMRGWSRAAQQVPGKKKPRRRLSKGELSAKLASMGIEVTWEKNKPSGDQSSN